MVMALESLRLEFKSYFCYLRGMALAIILTLLNFNFFFWGGE